MSTKQIARIAIATTLICVLAPISIPLQPVPTTLQMLIMFIVCLILSYKEATIAIFLYVVLGAMGLPVFANYSGGFHYITQHTGGYIVAFPLVPLGFLITSKLKIHPNIHKFLGTCLSFFLVSSIGVTYLYYWMNANAPEVVAKYPGLWHWIWVGMIILFPFNAIKGIIAIVVTNPFNRHYSQK